MRLRHLGLTVRLGAKHCVGGIPKSLSTLGEPTDVRDSFCFGPLVIAALAISGFPGFSGFFSKDAILSAAYVHAPWMFWVGALTAFYVFRAIFMAFFGDYRGHHHPHESPMVMTLPLVALALLSLGGGFLSVPNWLSPTFPLAQQENVPILASDGR